MLPVFVAFIYNLRFSVGAASVAVSRPFNKELVPNPPSHLKMASGKRRIGSERQESSSQQSDSGLAKQKKRNIEVLEQKQKKSSSTTVTPNSSSTDLQQTENQCLKMYQTLEDGTAKSVFFSWQTSGVPKGLLETTPLLGTTVGSSQQVQHCHKSVTGNIQRHICSQGLQLPISKPITTMMRPPLCRRSDLPVSTAKVTHEGPPQQYSPVARVDMVERETTDPNEPVHLAKQQQSRTVPIVSLESVSHWSKHDQETGWCQTVVRARAFLWFVGGQTLGEDPVNRSYLYSQECTEPTIPDNTNFGHEASSPLPPLQC